MKSLSLLALIAVALWSLACPLNPVGPGDAGAADSGGAHDGAGSDGAQVDSAARDSAGPDGAIGDGGAGLDVSGFDLQGLDLADFDAGLMEYDGSEEPGVMCAGSACSSGVNCCAGFGTACDDGNGCGMLTIPVPCDGPEDCGTTQECCVTGTSASDYSISCVDQGTCAGTLVCTNSEACGDGMVCCSAQVLVTLGADLGWCEVDHCGE